MTDTDRIGEALDVIYINERYYYARRDVDQRLDALRARLEAAETELVSLKRTLELEHGPAALAAWERSQETQP